MKPFRDHTNYELLKKGSTSALSEIYSFYNRRIYWIGRRLIEDSFVVETLVQDTFLKLWVNRESIESPQHIFNFLRFVMTRECNHFYSRPKNKFLRKMHSLEYFGNYQDYMASFDLGMDAERLEDQTRQHQDFGRIKSILPVLKAERRHLIELCLKYGFQYKAISELMGLSITETSREVKLAIRDIKIIIDEGRVINTKNKTAMGVKVHGSMTEQQAQVLKLRCEKHYSFAAIATALNLTQKEVHSNFMIAYRFLKDKHQQQFQSA